jgi:hypothetical protein
MSGPWEKYQSGPWTKYAESAEEQEPPKDKGFFSNVGSLIVEGGKRAIGAAQVSPSVIAGDVGVDKAKILSEQLSMKPSVQPKELVEAQTAFKDEAEAFEKAKGFTESIGPFGAFMLEFGKQIVTNPKGAVYLTASSAANMAPQIAGMIAGGKGGALLGSAAGPGGAAVGAAAGAIGGGFAAGVPLEVGSEFIGRISEKLSERGLKPTEENIAALLRDKSVVEQAVSEARTKGVTTAAVDSLMTVGAGKFASGPRRAAIDAARMEVGAAADAAKIAARADEILKARTMTQKVGRGAGAVGIETAGGGASEAAGQLAAYGKVDLEDVGAEMLGELGGSAVSVPAAAYSTTQDMLKDKAKKDAAAILADEATAEQKRIADAERARVEAEAAEKEKPLALGMDEPFKPVVFPDGSVATTPEDVARYEEQQFQKKYAEQPKEKAADVVIPEDDNYALLVQAKERLRQQETPEARKMMARIDERLNSIVLQDVERMSKEAEATKTAEAEQKQLQDIDRKKAEGSVFGQEALPEMESRDVVVGNEALANLQAKETPAEMTDFELNRAKTLPRKQPRPATEEDTIAAEQDKELKTLQAERNKIKTGGNLYRALEGQLSASDVEDISPDIKKLYGKGYRPLVRQGGVGTDITELVDDGLLDDFLPDAMKRGAANYDVQESAEYIKNKLRTKDTRAEVSTDQTRELDEKISYLGDVVGGRENAAKSLAEVEPGEAASVDRAATDQEVGDATDIRYKRSTGKIGIGKRAVQDTVDTVKSRWANSPEVVVAESMDDPVIPQEVRDHNKEAVKNGAKGTPQGFYYNGKAYVIADSIESTNDAVEALMHEALGHFGLRGVFGPKMEAVLRDVIKNRRADVESKAEQYGLDPKNDKDMLEAAEEVLAVMAQTKPGLPFVKRALAIVRNFLRDLGFNIKMSDADLIEKYILPARAFVESGKGRTTEGKPAAARGAGNQIYKDADAIAAMDEDVRDNTEIGDFPGGSEAYNLYEARKLLKKPSDKLKRVTDSNSFSLWQDWDYVANVDGEYFGVSKEEDPDSTDVDDDAFVFSYARLDDPRNVKTTYTSDVGVLMSDIRADSMGDKPAAMRGETKQPLDVLRQADDLFAMPKSEGKTIAEITKDHDPEITVKEVKIPGNETFYNLTMPDGTTARITVRKSGPNSAYDSTSDADNNSSFESGRPGENPEDVDPYAEDVWIDVSRLKPGQNGIRVYSIASTFAHNTDRIFIGDPNGLSDEAMRRRAENMLSSALKFGTTKHLAPHPRQTTGGAGVPPLKWVYGDDVGNIERLVDLNLKALDNANPNAKNLTYDLDSGKFTNTKTGQSATKAELLGSYSDRSGSDSRPDMAAKAQAGWRTLARGAIFRAILGRGGAQGNGAGRSGESGSVLAGLVSQREKLASPNKDERVFYSRSVRAADPNNADIRYSRQNIKGQPVLAKWTTPTDTKLYGDTNKDDIIYSLQNKMIDTKRVVDAISATAGKIMAKWNPYLQEELYHGRTAKQTADFLKKELRPLMQDMSARGVDIKDFEKYLQNRHAEDYNAHVAKIGGMPDGGSGIKNADARAYLAGLTPQQKADFDALAKKMDAINKGTREVLVAGGLETRDTIDQWEKTFPYYVPLKRDESTLDYAYTSGGLGTGQGFDVRGNFSKSATGSDKAVVDILANSAMQRERAIVKAEKNRVAQAMFGLALQSPNPEFWLPIDPMAEVDPAAAQDLLSFGLSQQDLDFLMKEPRQKSVDKKSGEIVERINATLRNNENVMSMRFNGRDRYVFFNPSNPRSKRMIESLKNLDADQLGRILGTVSQVTRWMAAVNTQYNPVFGAYNFLRDVQGATLQLSTTPLANDKKAVVAGTLPALKGIYAALRAERDGTTVNTPWATLWNEFQEEGGQTGFRDQFSRSQERTDALQKELKMITEGKLKSAGRGMFNWLSDYNESMENAVRLSAYKAALDKGIDKQEAASIAKNLTVNFNRKGQITVQAGALYAFFNAAIQGTTRLAETLKGPAGKKIIGGGLLLGTMQAALLAGAGFDDEEPPEFVRERNLIIPLGGDKYFAFPMPLGYHVIPGTSRIITEWALSGFKNTPDRIASLTGMFLDAFNPVGNAGWSAQTLAPTFADPIVALTENKDYTGKPIARKDFDSRDPTPGYTRTKEATNIVFKKIAEYLNLASGGTDFKPGIFSPTPDQLEYLFGQATGGVGREISKLVTTVEKTVTGEDLPSYKIPLVGRFYGETKSSAAESGRFYANMEKLNKHENEIKGRREKKQPMGDYLTENPEARLAPMARATDQEIRKLRKRRESLIERDAPKESVQAVEKMITRKMQVLNDRVRALEESN